MIWFTIPIELKVKSLASTESSSNLIPSMNNNHNANMESPKDIIPSTNNDGKKRHIESPESNKEFFKKPRSNDDLTMSGSEGEEYNEYLIKSDNSKRVKCALIIDDTKIIRKTFERVLTSIGYTVKQANNGLQGLLQMKTIMFDVVFCDFLMPLMDGLDCVKQYRAWESEQRPNFQQVRKLIIKY
jgi:PleD family two-component response regulator